MRKLYVIGLGPGDKDLITPAAQKLIAKCDCIIGGKRNLELFRDISAEKLAVGSNLEEIYQYIVEYMDKKSIAVLVTGDPGLYSMMEFLKRRLSNVELEVIPGISSFQYLCSRMKISWDDCFITSVHGREQEDLPDIIRNNGKVAIFAGGGHKPNTVCRQLLEAGLENLLVTVGENLSYPNERIAVGTPEIIGGMNFENLAIMIVQHNGAMRPREWGYSTPGIPDDRFIRGKVPMTKEEVRAVSLSKLRLKEDSIVFDIGAGTGSVAVECALRSKKGRIYAIEKNHEAIELIHKNTEKFGAGNMVILEGEAMDIIKTLPQPDRVFIGGSGGNMADMLEWVRCMEKEVRVVINTVTVESTYEALESLKNSGFEGVEVVSMSVSRSRAAGGKHLMEAMNPINIISATKLNGKPSNS